MKDKILIFDASSLISFAMNGLLHELRELKKVFPGKFMIPKEVKYEIIDRPITIKRFELEALKLNELVEEKILESPSDIGINEETITKETMRLLDIANSSFKERGQKDIHLIDKGETACLVLSKMLSNIGVENILAIDERTTRMLCEKPENLKKLLQKKLHTRVDVTRENLKNFKGFKIIRSCELIFIAYKKEIVKIKNKKILEALLYALKYKGCAISFDEIEQIKKMA